MTEERVRPARPLTRVRRVQRYLQRASWLVSLACLGYLYFRFDTLTLPSQGCSPVLRYRAGVPLLLDRWAGEPDVGDVVLFESPRDGAVLIGLVGRAEDEGGARRFWIDVDNPDCPGLSSAELGWIGADAIRARVLFAWPF